MPITYDANMWAALYRRNRGTVDGVHQGYVSYSGETFAGSGVFDTRKDWLTGYGLDNNASILVVGCAYGFLMEQLIDAGITDVWGIDPSPHIWEPAQAGEWRADVKPRVVNDWVGSGTEKASLNAAGVGGAARFTFIVDDDAASSHSDAELPVFIDGCEARLQGNARSRIVHIVTPARYPGYVGDSALNWKTIDEWKAVAPTHTWVDAVTGEVTA